MQFLTTFSSPFQRRAAAEINPSAVDYFALVGLLLGLVVAGLDLLFNMAFPPTVVGALVILSLVMLTGALHLDGLMDACDGIFNRGDPERRLEIMRDSRVGAFGVVGLAVLMLVKYAAVVSLPASMPQGWWEGLGLVSLRSGGLILMATAARLAMGFTLVSFPYARASGLGKMFKGERRVIALALNTALVAGIAFLLLGTLGIISLVISGAAVWLGALYIMTKIPGLTGDTYGALGELAEVVILLVLVAGR